VGFWGFGVQFRQRLAVLLLELGDPPLETLDVGLEPIRLGAKEVRSFCCLLGAGPYVSPRNRVSSSLVTS